MIDPPRRAAYDVLRAVRVDDAYANLALSNALRAHGLSGRDAAFATELVSGTLRRRGTYDAVLASCATRPLANTPEKVLDALRLGTHQLLGMRVPAHAAISTTVDLVVSKAGRGSGGFANAVLRKVSERDLDTWVPLVAPDAQTDPLGHLSVAHSHPRWVVAGLARALGVDKAALGSADGRQELEELLRVDNQAPRVTLVARPGRSTRVDLPGEPTPFSPYGVILDSGDPGGVPAVRQGRAGVQDEGSQLVALALAAAVVEGRDERWLDLCAGPGGKAALLAGLAGERGAILLAVERQPHRSALVASSLRGAGAGVAGIVTADGTRGPWSPGSFDRVLVDAPCTGLGALRRRPEARWRRTPEDLTALVPLQSALLGAAVDAVRPGGAVVYATCSPLLAETAGVVAALLEAREDVALEDASGLLPAVPDCAGPTAGTVQLWPHRHGTDAMFIALLRRTV